MTSLSNLPVLVEQLKRHGVTLHLVDGQVKLKRPWAHWEDAPQEAQELLRQVKGRKMEILGYLRASQQQREPIKPATTEVIPGLVVRLYKTRPDCLAAGFCKWVTHEDCNLYPVTRGGKLSGWCRERVPGGRRQRTDGGTRTVPGRQAGG